MLQQRAALVERRSTMKSLNRDATSERSPRVEVAFERLDAFNHASLPLRGSETYSNSRRPRAPPCVRSADDAHAAHAERRTICAPMPNDGVHAAMQGTDSTPEAASAIARRHEIRAALRAAICGEPVVVLCNELQRVAHGRCRPRQAPSTSLACLADERARRRRLARVCRAREREPGARHWPRSIRAGRRRTPLDSVSTMISTDSSLRSRYSMRSAECRSSVWRRANWRGRRGAPSRVVGQDFDDDGCGMEASQAREIAAGFLVPRA